jgi:hypothetical protein
MRRAVYAAGPHSGISARSPGGGPASTSSAGPPPDAAKPPPPTPPPAYTPPEPEPRAQGLAAAAGLEASIEPPPAPSSSSSGGGATPPPPRPRLTPVRGEDRGISLPPPWLLGHNCSSSIAPDATARAADTLAGSCLHHWPSPQAWSHRRPWPPPPPTTTCCGRGRMAAAPARRQWEVSPRRSRRWWGKPRLWRPSPHRRREA